MVLSRWYRAVPPAPAAATVMELSGPVVRVAADAHSTAAADRLDVSLPAGRYDGRAFAAAIDELRQAAGVNIFVDWQALAGRVHPDLPLTLVLPPETFRRRLERVLRAAGGEYLAVNAVVRGEVVFVSAAVPALRMAMTTRMYDVRHVIRPERRAADAAALIRRVYGVAPASWDSRNGGTASVQEVAGHLVVRQTEAVQDRIAAVLADPGFVLPAEPAASRGGPLASGSGQPRGVQSQAWPATGPATSVAPDPNVRLPGGAVRDAGRPGGG